MPKASSKALELKPPRGNGRATEDAELRALERDLAVEDEKGLVVQDDYKTTIDALLVILQGDARTGTPGLDEQRAQLRQRIAIAIELKEKDEARNLKESYQKVLKRMSIVLRRLVDALATEQARGLRENVTNWLHVRMNLRNTIVGSLRVRHKIDLGPIIAQAVQREDDARRSLARDAEDENLPDAEDPPADS